MTRKRPVFAKEDSTDSEEWDEKGIDYGNHDRRVCVPLKKKKEEEPDFDDDDSTELEDFDESVYDNKFEFDQQPKQNDENMIIKIDKYWPYGMDLDGEEILPENKSLLYLYSIDLIQNIIPCEFCKINEKSYYKMSIFIMYNLEGGHVEEASLENFPKAFAKYIEKFDSGLWKKAELKYLLKPVCCSKAITKQVLYLTPSTNIIKPQLIKYFACKKSIHIYLKINSKSIPAIPVNIDSVIISKLREKYLLEALKKLNIKGINALEGKYSERSEFSDTFDFPEAEIPAGFKINLRSYQLRSISWMKEIEASKPSESNTISYNFHSRSFENAQECLVKLKLGHTPFYVELNGLKYVTLSPETTKTPPLRFYGGVLADDTGSGKTATTLGLIHASPLNEEKSLQRFSRSNDLTLTLTPSLTQSKATLIICPSNIYKQWIFEAKKCNPNFKICGFSTILDHRKVSIQDVIDADIVVVSYQFLTNYNYCQLKKGLMSHFSSDTKYFCVKGYVNIHLLHYHRIILDEFHELAAATTKVQEYVKAFKADYVWGLTGTPHPNILSELFMYSIPSKRILENEVEAKFKHVKRNVPNLELPPIETETVWIELSAHEMALLKWKGRESGIKGQIMMCSHYQLNEKESVAVNDFMSIDAAQKKMSARKSQEIDALKQELIQLHYKIETILKEKPDANVNYYQSQLKIVEPKLASAQSNYNYFQNVFKVIGEPDKNECLICYDNIPADSLSILPCSHLYCFDCIKGVIAKSNACPLCRNPATEKEIFCIRIKNQDEVPKTLFSIDTSRYSSKLVGLYRYITDLIKNDGNARIILFLQFSDLADFISDSFKELGVEYVRVAGNVFQRQNAISKFRDSENVRLIMMSSEDSVSGINLTQATHVILLHPFWTGNEATDLAYEKQGISRAYRFGLDHKLKVVRFAVRGSVEEEITLRRENIKLSN